MAIDSHTHSMFSHDSTQDPNKMIQAATNMGLGYLAFTDHCDRDCLVADLDWTQIDLSTYVDTIGKLKQEYKDSSLYIAMGIELGYAKEANKYYLEDLAKYDFDVIINSIHLVDLEDIYFSKYFENKTKFTAYEKYLLAVNESLDAPYDYDIVGHLGYIMRNAPFSDKSLLYSDYANLIDEILCKIIKKDKVLEVNAHVKQLPLLCLPDTDILIRYRELGGTRLSYGSDAHSVSRLACNYDKICEHVKGLGFSHWTIYKERKAHEVPID